jgi:hypothetical protein
LQRLACRLVLQDRTWENYAAGNEGGYQGESDANGSEKFEKHAGNPSGEKFRSAPVTFQPGLRTGPQEKNVAEDQEDRSW